MNNRINNAQNPNSPVILILAGTSDARHLCEQAVEKNISVIASVVTKEAASHFDQDKIPVHIGRLEISSMGKFILENKVSILVDATHPFADKASLTAIAVAKEIKIPYIRYERPESVIETETEEVENDAMYFAADYQEAVDWILNPPEELRKKFSEKINVFLTTGSKTLELFARQLLPRKNIRLIIRLLPSVENLELCQKHAIPNENIVAMKGPFSKELNKALFESFNTNIVVTKLSGKEGSTDEKIQAARELNIPVIAIERPAIDYPIVCTSPEQTLAVIRSTLSLIIPNNAGSKSTDKA
jgi:precorrin-6A/cobalt-precorrin-6A reductase